MRFARGLFRTAKAVRFHQKKLIARAITNALACSSAEMVASRITEGNSSRNSARVCPPSTKSSRFSTARESRGTRGLAIGRIRRDDFGTLAAKRLYHLVGER